MKACLTFIKGSKCLVSTQYIILPKDLPSEHGMRAISDLNGCEARIGAKFSRVSTTKLGFTKTSSAGADAHGRNYRCTSEQVFRNQARPKAQSVRTYLRCAPGDAHLGALARSGGVRLQTRVECVLRPPMIDVPKSAICHERTKHRISRLHFPDSLDHDTTHLGRSAYKSVPDVGQHMRVCFRRTRTYSKYDQDVYH